MTTKDLAGKLVSYCRSGDFKKAITELYADDAVSIEPHATPAFDKETKGKDAILAKGEKWNGMLEKVHAINVSDPVVADTSFACTMHLDVTMKERGKLNISEVCVYQVKDGKIVTERFFM